METPHLDKEIEFIENTHWKFAKNEVWQSKLVEYKAIKQAKGELLPDYELDYCNKCMQMTNHLDGICQKCKGNGA